MTEMCCRRDRGAEICSALCHTALPRPGLKQIGLLWTSVFPVACSVGNATNKACRRLSNGQHPRAPMRYYFHLTDGKEVVKLPHGVELPGRAAAREDALVLARDLREGKVMPARKWDDWFIRIVDEHGHEVDTIPVAAVPGRPEPPLS